MMPREWIYNGGQGTPVVEDDEELQVKHVAVSTRQDFTEDEQKQARDNIGASSKSDLAIHIADKENPHEVTAEQVGAYTKEQVDGFIRNWSGYVVVPFGQQKPEASEAQLGKIYLVQVSNDPTVKDQYEEWISDGTAWSLIGTMEIDLSPYDKIVDAEAREKAISDALAEHVADKSNPHEVTAGQVGAYTKSETDARIAEATRDIGEKKIVTELPPLAEADKRITYLLVTDAPVVYEQYCTNDTKTDWIYLGDTQIDLSDYETKADAKAKANTYGVDLSSTRMSSGTFRVNITRPNLS